MKDIRRISMVLAVIVISLFPLGCREKGPFEKAGERVDEAVDDTGDAIEDAGDEVEDSMKRR